MNSIQQQLRQWYGQPGNWFRQVVACDQTMIGASPDVLESIAAAVQQGQTVSLISSPRQVYRFARHPLHDTLTHQEFYDCLGAPVPLEEGAAGIWNDRGNLLYVLGWREESQECLLRALTFDAEYAST